MDTEGDIFFLLLLLDGTHSVDGVEELNAHVALAAPLKKKQTNKNRKQKTKNNNQKPTSSKD